jgi:hypothetical protein
VIVPFLEMDIKAGSGGRDGSQAYILDIKEEGMGLDHGLRKVTGSFVPNCRSGMSRNIKKHF